MATVAHGRTSSNNQRGTVGLSAGDWIRLKRLQGVAGARNYADVIANNTDVDVPTVPQTAYSVPFLKAKHTGSSRIRRTNEQWIAYRASQTGDFVRNGTFLDTCQYPRMLYPTRICNCSPLSEESFYPKLAGGKCCVGKPLPPQNLVADLEGLVFAPDLGGDAFSGTYTFPSTHVVNVSFINAPQSLSLLGTGSDVYFRTGPGILTSSDTITITNPTQNLTTSFYGSDSLTQLSGFLGSLTPSSVVTLTTANPVTSVLFSVE